MRAFVTKALGGLVGTALLALGAGASGAEGWSRVASSGRCSIPQEVLERRVTSVLVGERDAALRVTVTLADDRAGTLAAVQVARGAQTLGRKQLRASDCSEAIEAVVAVVALAVGAAPADTPITPSSDAPPPLVPAAGARADRATQAWPVAARTAMTALPAAAATPTAPEADGGVGGAAAGANDNHWRLLLSAGADRGVLSAPTAIVGAGAALALGLAEWRAQLWYGLPSRFERDENGRLDRERSDFAAAALDHCRTLASARWLALCAGLEARVTRLERISAPASASVSTSPAGARTERERLEPGAAARASAALVFPGVGWQPRFDVAALVPVVGTSADPLGIRASFGAALPF